MPSTVDELLPPEVEDKLRLRAFRLFYDKAFADEPDLAVRFAKAIVASAGPIRDPVAAADWDANYRRKHACS